MARKKNYDVQRFNPLTDNQELALNAWKEGQNLVLLGYPGTGKTHIAVHLALQEVAAGRADGLVIVRSAVPTREQGFLPGDAQEKLEQYAAPYIGIVDGIVRNPNTHSSIWKELIREGLIEFTSTSYLRGINIDNKIVVVDEINNCTRHELETVLTRCGENARIIFSGDRHQSDLTKYEKNDDMSKFVPILERMTDFFSVVRFGPDDIVRSELVREYILTKIELYPDLV